MPAAAALPTAALPTSALPPARALSALGQAALRTVVDSGLLRCAVPVHLGGTGDGLEALRTGATRLAAENAAAGWVLWAQRLAIEALVHSPNIGLRDHLLPDLLSGERAGTLPLPPWPGAVPAAARLAAMPTLVGSLVAEAGRHGLRLYGLLPCVPNLQWQGHVLVAPLQLEPGAPVWVLLRGEEDGLRAGMDLGAPCPPGSRCAALTLDGVFFRADEELAGPDLPTRLQPVAEALAAGLVAC